MNWAIKPFTMYAIAIFFLGVLFRGLIGAEATDLVKMPFGLDLPVGATHGAGTVVLHEGVKMLQVPLWRSYLAGLHPARASRPARPWCWCGATWRGATTG
ncbi:MAG: hypothetical protein M0C28_00270 [Candidatus Moduliflexus flocculans]|nr:hypothetical protein [Candidatus Moduliflexus flocculans]